MPKFNAEKEETHPSHVMVDMAPQTESAPKNHLVGGASGNDE